MNKLPTIVERYITFCVSPSIKWTRHRKGKSLRTNRRFPEICECRREKPQLGMQVMLWINLRVHLCQTTIKSLFWLWRWGRSMILKILYNHSKYSKSNRPRSICSALDCYQEWSFWYVPRGKLTTVIIWKMEKKISYFPYFSLSSV